MIKKPSRESTCAARTPVVICQTTRGRARVLFVSRKYKNLLSATTTTTTT